MIEKNTVQMKKNTHAKVNAGIEKESGMVSAETALSALALALVFILMLSVIGASVLYIHAQDLSRSAARSLSLGHSVEEVRQSVSDADSRATMQLKTGSDSLAVTVRLEPPAPVKTLGIAISATTIAPMEPGAAP